ncbi:Competence protein F homolog, phosphoribosyltransferase domain; protein YhgH required for utilization of DNA as sole source of carbon and energy [hydrothermal vent metagenome]|uniref:Competence protein F homolog, phosphoribosyltransferase domain protein YhgH required for utilization of DNA as sole source of carbon and energy n=1 Tax=hydrothermal vent metagenome TaxID=652676 RepID=A0A3B0WH78_9ZZZZ
MELAQILFSNLFPSRCILCQQTVSQHFEVCSDCYQTLPHNKHCCGHCSLPLAEDIKNFVLCGRCIQILPAFDYAHSPFRYEEAVIGLVHQLKFSEKISFARTIGEMLLVHLSDTNEKPDCILPVPLHKTRLRQRGFNQSIEISRVLAKKLGVPIERNAVIRKRSTIAQAGLNAKQRKKNIKGAFSIVGQLNYKHILIVDDVMTTGATVNELAKVLKKNKVARVGVLSIARAPAKT